MLLVTLLPVLARLLLALTQLRLLQGLVQLLLALARGSSCARQ
jgi:hypothetical protein